jgi:hypothetical protein
VGVITRKENRPKGGESPPCRGLPWGKKLEETPPVGGQKFLTLGVDRVKNEVYCVNTLTRLDLDPKSTVDHVRPIDEGMPGIDGTCLHKGNTESCDDPLSTMSVSSTKECPASTVRVCTTPSTGDTDARYDHESAVDHVDRGKSVPRDVADTGPMRKFPRDVVDHGPPREWRGPWRGGLRPPSSCNEMWSA